MTGGRRIERLAVSAYSIPTEAPESDGTLEWARPDGSRPGLGLDFKRQDAAAYVA